ncbi:hypothetical protein ABZ502_11330 [Streptomyces abikoensis]|uniref:hypothetical protein n=1 Tax=Streptomyces abikoensis TaxID=97398 RepID=UPI0034047B5C
MCRSPLSDERVLPGTAPAVVAMHAVRMEFPDFGHTELDAILPGWVPGGNAARSAELDRYARRLSALPGAVSVRTATGIYAHGSRTEGPSYALADRYLSTAGTSLAVYGPTEPFGPAGVRLARAVRTTRAPTAPLVTGPPARLLDVQQVMAPTCRPPGVVLSATFVVLILFSGGLFLAIKTSSHLVSLR